MKQPQQVLPKRRRIASHELLTENGQTLPMQVVEIVSGRVVDYYKLQQELAHTEWLAGCTTLCRDAFGHLCAYHEGKKIE